MTEKLYYLDAYTSTFEATVLECRYIKDGEYLVVLDKTAFFPKEGGQTSDTGLLNEAVVYDVQEQNGVIYHKASSKLDVGSVVKGRINFDERFEKMQLHTAEHIICGIINREYGYDNVGFHLSKEYVTFDINGYLTRDMLNMVEKLANEVVYKNIEVLTSFPAAEKAQELKYRSKLEYVDNLRIVTIGEYDSCACCAPHVSRTGEIGMIKMLDFEKHKGGVRIYLTAGRRALRDYQMRYNEGLKVSSLLSVPQNELADGVNKLLTTNSELKYQLKEMKLTAAEIAAERIEATDDDLVVYFPDMGMDELRAFSKKAITQVGGLLVALSGCENDYKYLITSADKDLSKLVKDINGALNGRGGGKGEMIQGAFFTSIDNIKSYFNKKTDA